MTNFVLVLRGLGEVLYQFTSFTPLKTVLANNSLDCLCTFTVSEICSWKSSIKKDLKGLTSFTTGILFPLSCSLYHPEHLIHLIFCYKRVTIALPKRSNVCCTNLNKCSIKYAELWASSFACSKPCHNFPSGQPWQPTFFSGYFHKSSLGSISPSDFSIKKLNYKLIHLLYLLEIGWYSALYQYGFLKILPLNKDMKMAIPIFRQICWDFPMKMLLLVDYKRFFKSWFIYLSIGLTEVCNFIKSAKWFTLDYLVLKSESPIQTRNSKIPHRVPWDTLHFM